jgi:hypothetical protein
MVEANVIIVEANNDPEISPKGLVFKHDDKIKAAFAIWVYFEKL